MPAGVGLVSDSVFFEGSAELIAAAFISAPDAKPVTDAKTRPTKMHLGGKSLMPADPLFDKCSDWPAVHAGAGGRHWPYGSLLIRGSLGIRLIRVGLVRFVMADDAPGRCTKFAVSRHVAGDTADDGPLDAALGVRSGRESERNCDCESRRQNPSHVRSPIVKDRKANQSGRTLFRPRRALLRQHLAQPPRALSASHESDLADPIARQAKQTEEIGTAEAGHRRTDSSVPAVLADARERNAAFPSLHPAPLRPCRTRPGCLRTMHGRRRGRSSAPGSRVRRRRRSCGYTHALPEFSRDAPSFASFSFR